MRILPAFLVLFWLAHLGAAFAFYRRARRYPERVRWNAVRIAWPIAVVLIDAASFAWLRSFHMEVWDLIPQQIFLIAELFLLNLPALPLLTLVAYFLHDLTFGATPRPLLGILYAVLGAAAVFLSWYVILLWVEARAFSSRLPVTLFGSIDDRGKPRTF